MPKIASSMSLQKMGSGEYEVEEVSRQRDEVDRLRGELERAEKELEESRWMAPTLLQVG